LDDLDEWGKPDDNDSGVWNHNYERDYKNVNENKRLSLCVGGNFVQ